LGITKPFLLRFFLFVFDYLPNPHIDPETGKINGQIYYPVIPIKIGYGHQIFGYLINSLVDSGSDRNLFPSEIGERIGIKIKKGIPQEIGGIGAIKIIAFTHKVKIYLKDFSIDTFVDFSYEQNVPPLGRTGFFNYFEKVIFKERKRVIEIEKKQD